MSQPVPSVAPIGPSIAEPPMEVLRAVQVPDPLPAHATAPPSGAGFSDLVARGLQHVNERLVADQVDLQRMSVGDTPNLHDIMIRLEESRLSFQLLMQVRNRVLEAYQDVMKMQV